MQNILEESNIYLLKSNEPKACGARARLGENSGTESGGGAGVTDWPPEATEGRTD